MLYFQTIFCIFLIFPIFSIQSESFDHIIALFEHKQCIEGTLTSILDRNENEIVEKTTIKSLASGKREFEKSILSSLHELATHNEISYDYELIEEQGLSHNKEFTVKLTLGDEQYHGVGSSLKSAQREAAAIALQQTDYEHPPIKLSNDVPKTPTVILNNIGSKLAIPVKYFLIKDLHEQEINWKVEDRPYKSYVEKLNDSIYDPHYKSNVPNEDPHIYGPFTVRVQVGENSFTGLGHTVQAARHDAAANAIKGLKKEALEQNSPCMKEGDEKECKQARNALRSPVSLVHEAGQKRKIDVSFDVVNEEGPAHKRVFTMRCTLGHLTTEAEGHSKKDAKRRAAELMMERMDELPELSDEAQILSSMKSDKKKKNKKKKIKKNNVQKLGSMLESAFETLFPSEPTKEQTNNKNSALDKEKSKMNEDGKPANRPSTDQKRRPRDKSAVDELLELSNTMKMEVQISDFQVKSKFYSFISLGIKPPVVCFGEEVSKPKSKEKAAYAALLLLHTKGLSYSFKKSETDADENECIADDNLYLSPFSEEKNE